ncbi:hypothetical protein PSPO01_13167 [Paraphaeosphaeria sporulosa]
MAWGPRQTGVRSGTTQRSADVDASLLQPRHSRRRPGERVVTCPTHHGWAVDAPRSPRGARPAAARRHPLAPACAPTTLHAIAASRPDMLAQRCCPRLPMGWRLWASGHTHVRDQTAECLESVTSSKSRTETLPYQQRVDLSAT